MKSNFLNIHDMVLVLAFFECLLLAILVRLISVQRDQSRNILAVFMIVIGGWILTTLLIWNEDLQKLAINSTVFSTTLLSICTLLQGPCLYLYLRSLMEPIDYRNWRLFIHLLPILPVVFVIFAFDLDGWSWLPWLWPNVSLHEQMAVKFCWLVTRCTPLIYIVACIYQEIKLRLQYRQVYSSISSLDIKLADCILIGFFLHWIWNSIGYFIGGYISVAANDFMGIVDTYLVVFEVNGLFFLGLLNSRELFGANPGLVAIPKSRASKDLQIAEDKIQLLEAAISVKRIYLENNINLSRFAELAGLQPREVTMILNQHYKINFFEFINGLRVDEAKRLLTLPNFDHLSILEILHKSGFNSQSAFQRFFKRLEGCSPSEFRKQAQQKRKQGAGQIMSASNN